ncbi:2-aminoethylphosphonate ABC transporter permease subunit [Amycolatopsis rubida]|uniref:2-aminoethylphosphonate ABC transporter permease subunit n=1 Tax=Amycolatopsis rubida TaxID=112413 RepID=A0A1I5QVG8_9PSEU|nr:MULTISPECIES: 2-aminoethylphosphonate ABC transporter permease subunit [Amycolatopsis]MYW95853.1 2-aminoethylphosphonate ABC transporter permease subunit [Amycolatopsis rubida]NEC60843.1 2-aminoethylphosphonate ABC transporter permease subunit [Amycolatopsis rubida]OAP26687.1 putative 2-aminoethylphosphonate transport system permease protein PhnU [Amycolatopsis sp. M39]SFP50259.1 2-aminoethylphosphonate transport system permease protein [Amycolatopsis rubida]
MTGLALGTAAVAPARRSTRPRRYRIGWLLPPAIVVAGFFGYPLVLVILQSFTAQDGGFGLSVWTQVLSSPEFGRAVWQTVLLALAATVGCVLLGGFLALVVAFVPFPGATLLARLVDTVLAFPSFLIALAFTFLYGGAGVFGTAGFLYSPWGVLLAEITFYTPFVMRPALAAFSQVPSAQLDVAASLGARPGRVLWRVVLPEALPSLASGACLVLLLTMNEFGIVLFLGAKGVSTLPMLVYGKGIVTFDFPAASVVAVVNVVLSLVLYAVYRRVVGRGGRRAAVDAA